MPQTFTVKSGLMTEMVFGALILSSNFGKTGMGREKTKIKVTICKDIRYLCI